MAFFDFFKPAAPRASISAVEVRDLIATAMESSHIELNFNGYFFVGDRKYSLVTNQEAFAAVRDSQTTYIKDRNDCDDTAFKAKAKIIIAAGKGKFGQHPACFGFIWSMSHAFNLFINDKRQVLMIDNDGTIRPPSWIKGQVRLVVI